LVLHTATQGENVGAPASTRHFYLSQWNAVLVSPRRQIESQKFSGRLAIICGPVCSRPGQCLRTCVFPAWPLFADLCVPGLKVLYTDAITVYLACCWCVFEKL